MKKYFLNFMICISIVGVMLSLASFVSALIDWNELDFWRGLALVLMNSIGLVGWIVNKQEE